MYSATALNLLRFVGGNVVRGIESFEEARAFAELVAVDLSRDDRFFLECALADREQMEEFHQALCCQVSPRAARA